MKCEVDVRITVEDVYGGFDEACMRVLHLVHANDCRILAVRVVDELTAPPDGTREA